MKALQFLSLPALLLLPALLALVAPQPTPTSQVECEPDYWFREQITLEQSTLPQGISLTALEAAGVERAGIRIENHTDELLFVLSLQYQQRLVEPTTPDPLYDARLRYAHEVASYLVSPEGARPITLPVPALLDLDHNLQQLNRLDASRPAEEMVLVPAAQQSMLLMVYGDQVLQVPFTITYSLNPDYAPAACAGQGTGTAAPAGTPTQSPSEKSASDVQHGLPGLALLVLIVVAILGANLISKLRSRS